MNKEGDLQVWWIPQIPMKSFIVPVKTINEAVLLLKTLAKYDRFQYKNNIKPDYASAGGLHIYEDSEWISWYNDEFTDIEDFIRSANKPRQNKVAKFNNTDF